ncbi:hypothetical protein [Nitrosovibrio tenuis]|uniref:Uncharacterized protein n=1 Tax=Nitrosovibrio tenuis TaxID=1233 RepID=A0A1H7R6Y8_9PROT|nr:hypothetical protein [Nitrosovibrio tenuis]SEL55909.1 hypothetical protein SAMN05216387_11531 [Nitrosovibrio tenuis]
MAKYVPYVRTAEGRVERKSYAIFNATGDSLSPYVHEEPLVGWPESKVYWASEAGPSVGIAPLNPHPDHVSSAEQ